MRQTLSRARSRAPSSSAADSSARRCRSGSSSSRVEGAFRRERPGDGVRHDPAAVDAVRLLVQLAAGLRADQPLERGQRRGGDPAEGVEAVVAQGAGGRGADAGQRGDGLAGEELRDGVRPLGHRATSPRARRRRSAIRASIGPGPAPITQSTPYRASARTRITEASSTASRPKYRSAPRRSASAPSGGRAWTTGVNSSSSPSSRADRASRVGGSWKRTQRMVIPHSPDSGATTSVPPRALRPPDADRPRGASRTPWTCGSSAAPSDPGRGARRCGALRAGEPPARRPHRRHRLAGLTGAGQPGRDPSRPSSRRTSSSSARFQAAEPTTLRLRGPRRCTTPRTSSSQEWKTVCAQASWRVVEEGEVDQARAVVQGGEDDPLAGADRRGLGGRLGARDQHGLPVPGLAQPPRRDHAQLVAGRRGGRPSDCARRPWTARPARH